MDQHDDGDLPADLGAAISEALEGSLIDLSAAFPSVLGQPWLDMQDTFKTRTVGLEPMFADLSATADAFVPDALAALAPMPSMHALANATESFGFGVSSAAAQLAESLSFSSKLADAELSRMSAMFEQMSMSANTALADQLAGFNGIADMFSTKDWSRSVLKGFDVPGYGAELPALDFPIPVNPLLETTIELAETNAEMHRRLEEMTALNREIRDEVSSLRQWQAESDKGAERWSRREVTIAFVAMLVSVAALVISSVQIL